MHELAGYECCYHLKPMRVVYQKIDSDSADSDSSSGSSDTVHNVNGASDAAANDTPASSSSSSSNTDSINGAAAKQAADEPSAQHENDLEAVVLLMRQFPQPWKAYLNAADGQGYRLAGTWEAMPSASAVQNIILDHISGRGAPL